MTLKGDDPNSAVCQFLDHPSRQPPGRPQGRHARGALGRCALARLIEGMDAADKMSGVEVGDAQGHDMVPKEPIVIESITLCGKPRATLREHSQLLRRGL